MGRKAKEQAGQENRLDKFMAQLVREQQKIVRLGDAHENLVIPSPIPAYNRASTVGGIVTGAVYSLDGQNQSGKTALGVINFQPFLERQNPTLFIDAEITANKPWFIDLGLDVSKCGYLVPDNITHASTEVDLFINRLSEFREEYSDMGAMILLDSLAKLRPIDEMENAIVDGERDYPRHADQITKWMNKLTPLLYRNDIAFMIVRHERATLDRKTPYQPKTHAASPEALKHDNSFVIRCNMSTKEVESIGGKDIVIGHWHDFVFEKNKDGISYQRGRFFLSNGLGAIPKGYSLGMSTLGEAEDQGIISRPSPKTYAIPEVKEGAFSYEQLKELFINDEKFVQDVVKIESEYWERWKKNHGKQLPKLAAEGAEGKGD